MSFLRAVLDHKRQEVARRKRHMLRARLEDMPKYSYPRVSLAGVLHSDDVSVIAEVRKAHVVTADRGFYDPLQMARQYVHEGANAIAVVTDEKFLLGTHGHIEQMRHFISVPILQRDFIIDPYQLYEAKACGADAVVLIAAALERTMLNSLALEVAELGLESLVEVSHEDEIDLLDFDVIRMVLINNRDPVTLETDIYTSVRVRKQVPSPVLVVSEGGITTVEDVELLRGHGIRAVYLGGQESASGGPHVASLRGAMENMA